MIKEIKLKKEGLKTSTNSCPGGWRNMCPPAWRNCWRNCWRNFCPGR